MVNQKRLVKNFLDLTKIDSISLNEDKIARFIKSKLEKLNFKVEEDGTGRKIGGKAGNLLATYTGNPRAPRIVFNAHMDTVQPGIGVKPKVTKDGVIKSDGKTILGGDDKVGIGILLELAHLLREEKIEDVRVLFLFTVAEEIGLLGAKNLKLKRYKTDYSYSLDSDRPVGNIVVRSPWQNSITAELKGKAAHSGVCPEKGINAIKAASLAISKMRLGRVNKDTTANIGIIKGGRAPNIVPDNVLVEGEARSFSLDKLKGQTEHMRECLKKGAKEQKATVKVEVSRAYESFNLKRRDAVVEVAMDAARAIGLKGKTISTGGGSDANILNQKGIPTAGLSIGVVDPHTTRERVRIRDLLNATRMVSQIIKIVHNRG